MSIYNRGSVHPLNWSILLVLSCLFISFLHGGFWLYIPFFNGTIAFGISIVLIVVMMSGMRYKNYLFRVEYGFGVVVFIVLAAINTLIKGISFTASPLLDAFYCMVIMVIAAYASDKPKWRKILLNYYLFEVIYKLLSTMIMLRIDPMIVREANFTILSVNGTGLSKVISAANLYSFAIIYLYLLANFKNLKHKVCAAIFMVATLIVLIQAQMTLILITTLVLTIYVLLVKESNLKKDIFVLITLLTVLLFFLPNILFLLVDNHIFGAEITERLEDVYRIFFVDGSFGSAVSEYGDKYSVTYSSTEGRLYFYIQSIRAAWHNFFMGEITPGAYITGGHAIWLDYIAKYGCLITILYCDIIRFFKILWKNKKNKKIIICVGFLYAFLGIVNSFSIRLFFIHIYILLPYFDDILIKRHQNRIYENEVIEQ